ncbi:hypothetical protein [Chryseobacterium vrystaatense]|uniref:Uncharacterized protein n=1 Tax=Chryseobacterium vrystaatense TaxID=307480 RepID=A0A1M5NNU9_9FLAO|nr:hypothetical protein [Chryseobacterium vrystaatense]SHG90603.1 hypothetical protein SAMN02787073_5033 [Chryseobacterium vrystaatense]
MANNFKNPWENGQWGAGSEDYTRWLPEDAAYFTGVNPQTGESINENEENTGFADQNVKTKNYLIVLDQNGKKQFQDTKNTIWTVKYIKTLADYKAVQEIVRTTRFKNFSLVHHGNIYSAVDLGAEEKVIMNVERMEQIENIVNQTGVRNFLDVDEDYFNTLLAKSKEVYLNGYPLNDLKAFCSIKALIGNINEGGSYFSVACDEADNPKLAEKLGEFALHDIRIFTNSNYSTINTYHNYAGITNYGSIMNSFLTQQQHWKDESGWVIYDTGERKRTVTYKDLWLFSKNSKKIYDLIARKKELSKAQKEKEDWAQTYFSVGFESQFVKKWGKNEYLKYIQKIESKYPEFKN